MPSMAGIFAFVALFAWLFFLLRNYLQRKLEGLTGDCLGAAIKLSEFSFFLVSCVLWPQI
jgi:cobalamin synthase